MTVEHSFIRNLLVSLVYIARSLLVSVIHGWWNFHLLFLCFFFAVSGVEACILQRIGLREDDSSSSLWCCVLIYRSETGISSIIVLVVWPYYCYSVIVNVWRNWQISLHLIPWPCYVTDHRVDVVSSRNLVFFYPFFGL